MTSCCLWFLCFFVVVMQQQRQKTPEPETTTHCLKIPLSVPRGLKLVIFFYLNLALCPATGISATARAGCCSSTNLCGFGRGTCTFNSDCQGNLVCDNSANAIATGRSANAATNNCGK